MIFHGNHGIKAQFKLGYGASMVYRMVIYTFIYSELHPRALHFDPIFTHFADLFIIIHPIIPVSAKPTVGQVFMVCWSPNDPRISLWLHIPKKLLTFVIHI